MIIQLDAIRANRKSDKIQKKLENSNNSTIDSIDSNVVVVKRPRSLAIEKAILRAKQRSW